MTATLTRRQQHVLRRIRAGEALPAQAVRTLVRRGLVRRIETVGHHRRHEWGHDVGPQLHHYEIVPLECAVTPDGRNVESTHPMRNKVR